MPGIVDGLVAAKTARVLGDNHALLPDDDPTGISLHLDGTAHGARRDRVFVGVEPHKAGLRYRSRSRMESVESPGHLHKGAAFILEDLPHCPICDLRMFVDLGIGNTLVEEPAVQLIQALHPEPRREEALADKTDLVLDLALFPARCRRARCRLDKIMAAHLQEATVIREILAEEDRLPRSLHVVVDAAGAGALEEGKRAIVRVEHHLLRLARIRPS